MARALASCHRFFIVELLLASSSVAENLLYIDLLWRSSRYKGIAPTLDTLLSTMAQLLEQLSYLPSFRDTPNISSLEYLPCRNTPSSSVMPGRHREVTKGSFPLTPPSQVQAVSRRMPWERNKHEGKVAGSLSASLLGGVNHAGRDFFWSEKAEKKGQPLPLWILLLTGPIPLCSSLLRPKEGLLALWFLAPGSGELLPPSGAQVSRKGRSPAFIREPDPVGEQRSAYASTSTLSFLALS
jgi:hypothetical protein